MPKTDAIAAELRAVLLTHPVYQQRKAGLECLLPAQPERCFVVDLNEHMPGNDLTQLGKGKPSRLQLLVLPGQAMPGIAMQAERAGNCLLYRVKKSV